MASLAPRQFVCRECARILRGLYRGSRYTGAARPGSRHYASTSIAARPSPGSTGDPPLRIGIIGSGPAGFYAAARVIGKMQDAIVDMYEQLPVPFGLVRFGVAPDHPEVKNCEERFEEVATSPRFNFIGNVNVGRDVPLSAIQPHYDALLFAYGASEDKTLGIPGENLNGIYSARAFVGWYNGLPKYAGLNPNLDSENAVVIGNGNVALDVARILLSSPDTLKGTDISSHAFEALTESKVKHVTVVGRRGPMQAAFTIKELRELMHLDSVGFRLSDIELVPSQEWISQLPKLQQRRYRIAKVMREGSKTDQASPLKQWSLLSLLSPVSFNSDSGADSSRLGGITFARNEYVEPGNRFLASARVKATDATEEISTNLAFRSIGYKSAPLAGLTADLGVPFDERGGTIPNDSEGRVLASSRGPGDTPAAAVPGCYCTGWVKSGPTGVIASTMEDAFATVDALAKDWSAEVPFLNGSTQSKRLGSGLGWEGVVQEPQVRENGVPRRVSWSDWLKIDQAERRKGMAQGKPRDKYSSIAEMLQVLD